jgi:hypothetical protein
MIEVALSLGPLVEDIAEELRDEISEHAPRDEGDYAKSWKTGSAKLSRDKQSVSAIAFSRHRPPGAKAPLGVILEYGAVHDDGTVVPPDPHIRPAVARVQARRMRQRIE